MDGAGTATAELVSLTPVGTERGRRPLLAQLVRDGDIIGAEPLRDARRRHQRALAELPSQARDLKPGGPAIPTRFS